MVAMFVVVAEVDGVDPEVSFNPYMLEGGGDIRPNHTIPVMAEAANVAYLMTRRCLHKQPAVAVFAFVAVRPLFADNLAKIPPLLISLRIFPESRLRSKFTLCKGENRSLPILLSSTVAIPGVASVEGLKLFGVELAELAAATAALLVLLIWLQADDDASLADVIETSTRLVEGVLSSIPSPRQRNEMLILGIWVLRGKKNKRTRNHNHVTGGRWNGWMAGRACRPLYQSSTRLKVDLPVHCGSSIFEYADAEGNATSLDQSLEYAQDTFGLQTMNQEGRLVLTENWPGDTTHMSWLRVSAIPQKRKVCLTFEYFFI